MFDRMPGWQVLLLLAPLVLVMAWIRRRELMAGTTTYAELNEAQKAWIFFLILPPGLAAGLLACFDSDEVMGYIRASSSIKGGGANLVRPVLKEFYRFLDDDPKLKRTKSDPGDMVEFIVERIKHNRSDVVKLIREKWPPLASKGPKGDKN